MSVNADHGTVLPAGASALVVNQSGELSFYMADGAEDEDLSRMVRLLAAVLVQSEDADWVDEMIATLDNRDPT